MCAVHCGRGHFSPTQYHKNQSTHRPAIIHTYKTFKNSGLRHRVRSRGSVLPFPSSQLSNQRLEGLGRQLYELRGLPRARDARSGIGHEDNPSRRVFVARVAKNREELQGASEVIANVSASHRTFIG